VKSNGKEDGALRRVLPKDECERKSLVVSKNPSKKPLQVLPKRMFRALIKEKLKRYIEGK